MISATICRVNGGKVDMSDFFYESQAAREDRESSDTLEGLRALKARALARAKARGDEPS